MNGDYLWDRSGEPDREVERLEALLGRFRHDRPGPKLPARGRALLALRPLLAIAATILLVVAASWLATRTPKPGWDVARLEGAPKVGSDRIGQTGRLAVGEWLETDGSSRARIDIGDIGEVEVQPNTRVRLAQARETAHRLALARGTIHAMIWAPPRQFFVETPSAVAVDLGCAYTLEVDETGAGLLHVSSGWVGFEFEGRESFVPAGALSITRPGTGPGTPYFADAPEALRAALVKFDFENGGAEALRIVLAESRQRDAFTLWHLLPRVQGREQARVYDRMASLVPPPEGVTRDGILRGSRDMLDLWWNALGLDEASWWRLWKGPFPQR